MKHTTQAKYPAPSAVVLKMFTDRAFHEKKLDQLGLKYRVLEHRAAPFMIRIERKVPMNAPGMVKKLFGAETTVVNEESWNPKDKTGKVKVLPQGVPIDVSCSATLKDAGDGCVISYAWDIHARVPLVGGALEKFVVADMERRADEENRLGAAMVKDYR
jgi:hypothetical protein